MSLHLYDILAAAMFKRRLADACEERDNPPEPTPSPTDEIDEAAE